MEFDKDTLPGGHSNVNIDHAGIVISRIDDPSAVVGTQIRIIITPIARFKDMQVSQQPPPLEGIAVEPMKEGLGSATPYCEI